MKKIAKPSMLFISTLSLLGYLPVHSIAKVYVQPIIHGKVQNDWEMNIKKLPKPKQVIKGGEDECNGGYFPDQYRYQDFTLLENGQIQEVMMKGSNGVVFHEHSIVDNMSQTAFKKKFKAFIDIDDTNPNIVNASIAEEGNDSIQFIFQAGRLQKYRLHFDNC